MKVYTVKLKKWKHETPYILFVVSHPYDFVIAEFVVGVKSIMKNQMHFSF